MPNTGVQGGFVNATRQNIKNYTTLPYNSTSPVSVDIARVGLLAKVWLRFKGKLTASHPTKTTFTKAQTAPYNLAQRLQLNLNSGTSVWNTSGYGAYLQNITNAFAYNLDQTGSSPEVFAFGNSVSAAGAANDLIFSYCLNLMINDRDPYGLLMLQNDATALTLQVEAALANAMMTDTDVTAGIDGAWEVSTEVFSIPADPANYPPLNRVHQVLEQNFAIIGAGENRQVFPRGNTYRRLINYLQLNGNLADSVESIRLVYNLTTTPYNVPGALFKTLHRERYGRDLPPGTYVWDMVYQGFPNMPPNARDLINSRDISDLSQFAIIPPGAALGANNNVLNTVFDQILYVTPTAV